MRRLVGSIMDGWLSANPFDHFLILSTGLGAIVLACWLTIK